MHAAGHRNGFQAEPERRDMPPETICKIVRQHNKVPVPDEDMGKLLEIAKDYTKVKNYVYQRYGGIHSLSKLYPGYTVQNEMTRSGLRESLGLPSVYFYLAIFDALGDIKSQWAGTKAAVLRAIDCNESLDEKEKHFLRYILKVSQALEAVLDFSLPQLPGKLKQQYDQLSAAVDIHKAENYLRRQIRKHHAKPHTDQADRFSVSMKAYRYGDHGIYIAAKEKRKRIFIPLTDANCYTRQISLHLYPEENRLELRIPIDVAAKKHPDYERCVGISLGMAAMLTTDEGHRYGEELGKYQSRLSGWIREQNTIYNKNRDANPGRKKYYANKQRLEEQLHGYINQELNRFLREERPAVVYLPRLARPNGVSRIKKVNYSMSMWQRGYIRERLTLKCREQSVELAEVPGKGISRECSSCGAQGSRKEGRFLCPQCGYAGDGGENTARNAKKRGTTGAAGI